MGRRQRKKAPTPELLYKYYGSDREDVFDSLLVRFSQLSALNDPFEFLLDASPEDFHQGAKKVAWATANPLAVAQMGLSQLAKLPRDNPQLAALPIIPRILVIIIVAPILFILILIGSPFFLKQMRSIVTAAVDDFAKVVINESRRGLVLIFSCSAIWNNVPMWAHYAGNHTGFAFGIDPSCAFRLKRKGKNGEEFSKPRIVSYQRDTPTVRSGSLEIADFLSIKMEDWSYEQEWRFFGTPDDATLRKRLPSGSELCLFALEKSSIREIIFGLNCPPTVIERIKVNIEKWEHPPELYVIVKDAGYGFKRLPLAQAPATPIEEFESLTTFDSIEFPQAFAAMESMVRDASSHMITRWFSRNRRS
ncbi:hypothetical protein QO010_004175 [Caulobacter ginsengisoli]|uniref:DUF2971 domain-containing protein n=1 Tax=Caulobacter ginsengisoli TaxID=400775 RepID=A0ABU0IZJ2_9CAUL|nr:DUF2971 domain-containing protein [Caulobacter ginsengisoli]MDQ0466382.1 hypothetical protein [Caulobacter ginsengisoli]